MTVILRYSNEIGSFEANYINVVEDRPPLAAKNAVLRIYFFARD